MYMLRSIILGGNITGQILCISWRIRYSMWDMSKESDNTSYNQKKIIYFFPKLWLLPKLRQIINMCNCSYVIDGCLKQKKSVILPNITWS